MEEDAEGPGVREWFDGLPKVEEAGTLRDRIAELGWVVQDTPTGSVLVPK